MEEVEVPPVFGDEQELFDVKVNLLCKAIILFQEYGVFDHELPITEHLNRIGPPETDYSKLLNIMVNIFVIYLLLTLTEFDTLALISVLEVLGDIVAVSEGRILKKLMNTLVTILVFRNLHLIVLVKMVHTCLLFELAANVLL
jgi:hypothetical protein